MNEELLQIKCCQDAGYHPQIYFKGWRVAYLNDIPKFHPESIEDMQRHDTSDEVFVLLEGSCTLYIGDGGDKGPGIVRTVELEPGVIYNVRRGAWHTHTTRPDTPIPIVGNANVLPEDSDHIPVNIGRLFRREEEKWPRRSEGSSLIYGRGWSTISKPAPSPFGPDI